MIAMDPSLALWGKSTAYIARSTSAIGINNKANSPGTEILTSV
jgi:hypothetical protein